MTWGVAGTAFRDDQGRHAFLHGINLVDKNPDPERPPWSRADLAALHAAGIRAVRLGVIWSAAMPEPGSPDQRYLDWVAEQVDILHELGIVVILDAH